MKPGARERTWEQLAGVRNLRREGGLEWPDKGAGEPGQLSLVFRIMWTKSSEPCIGKILLSVSLLHLFLFIYLLQSSLKIS